MNKLHHTFLTMLLGALWAAGASGQSAPAASGSTADGSARMAAYLAHVAKTADPVLNVYLNRARAAGMSTLLDRPMSPIQEMQLRVKIAREFLKAGQFSECIEELEYVRVAIRHRELPVDKSYFYMLRDQLGISNLRVGEEESGRRPPHSWIFPMQTPGGPPFDAGARKAIEHYTANLESDPEDLAARWLLNISYMAVGEHPNGVPAQWLIPRSVFESDYDIGHFTDIAATTGVNIPSHAGGSIIEDFDADGLLDIVTSSRGLRDQMRYFHNEGNGTFSDRTQQAGLIGQLGGLNMSHADYDNDGDRDITVWRGAWMGEAGKHANSLLQNQGNGRFEDVTAQAGILAFHPTHSGVWGDYDNDGMLDLFVGNESSPPPKPPHPNELYHNNGDGTFSNVAAAAGVAGVGFVKGAAWGDYDNDGMLDLYLSHLNGDNVLYHNNGDGTFTDVTATAGVAEPYVCFPTWFWDYDNDGWEDILVAGFDMADLGDMAAIHMDLPFGADYNRLYRNRGDGTFEEVAQKLHMDRVILSMGANYGDLDSDGYLDCYFGTGMPDMRTLLPNRMLRNAAGQRFQDVTTSGGFGTLQKGHGVSFGDLDNDGDQDIYHVLGAAFEGDVYENVLFENPGHGNRWLILYLEGVQSNRDAIGARIRVHVRTRAGSQRDIYLTVRTGGSFGSSPLRREIGLGDATTIEQVEVTWPAGKRQLFTELRLDSAYRLREGDLQAIEVALQSFDLSP
ncbi:MAG: CRTAC1 family protein [Gemmatimonadetes bacterium]|nr:CRTAC1 family protein [Gemmatimonadota bacterium]